MGACVCYQVLGLLDQQGLIRGRTGSSGVLIASPVAAVVSENRQLESSLAPSLSEGEQAPSF